MAVAISVSPTSASIKVGLTRQLTATVTGGTAGQTWASSDVTKATVNSSGLVTAVAVGTCNITATSTADGSKTAVCAITVTAAVAIAVSPTTKTLNGAGDTQQLTLTPTNTTLGATYLSSNTNVATVSSSGLITSVKAGTATITARSVEDVSKTATCAVTVKPKVNVVASQSVLPTEILDLKATVSGAAADSTLTYTRQSGTGTVVAGGYQVNLPGTEVVRVLSHEDATVFVDVTITVAANANNAHRIHLEDRDNNYIQALIQQRLESIDSVAPEAVFAKRLLVNLRKFGA